MSLNGSANQHTHAHTHTLALNMKHFASIQFIQQLSHSHWPVLTLAMLWCVHRVVLLAPLAHMCAIERYAQIGCQYCVYKEIVYGVFTLCVCERMNEYGIIFSCEGKKIQDYFFHCSFIVLVYSIQFHIEQWQYRRLWILVYVKIEEKEKRKKNTNKYLVEFPTEFCILYS